MSGENFEDEKVRIIVDNVILSGLDSEYVENNAVSKYYVDNKVQSAVNELVDNAGPAYDTLKKLKDALNAGDASLATQILTSIADEKKDREAGDLSLSDRVNVVSMGLENESGVRSDADIQLNSRVDGVAMEIQNAVMSLTEADSQLSSRIDTVTAGLETESGERSGADVQLSNRINTLSMSVEDLQYSKFDKTGGDINGDVKLVDSYLNFGENWRVKCSADGTKILFQHKKTDNVWRTALPFICSA